MPIRPIPAEDFREYGAGTVDDPRIIWMTNFPQRDPGRVEGCEDVARECARMYGFTHIWMRAADHATTRTKIRGRRVLRATDPHITVFYGNRPGIATYQADVFLVYGNRQRVPRRMARPQEMRLHRGNNPAMSRA